MKIRPTAEATAEHKSAMTFPLLPDRGFEFLHGLISADEYLTSESHDPEEKGVSRPTRMPERSLPENKFAFAAAGVYALIALTLLATGEVVPGLVALAFVAAWTRVSKFF